MNTPLLSLIEPNWHVALVHFPIALLTVGLVMEVGGVVVRSGAGRVAGRWMLVVGAVLGAVTAMSGLYAMAEVAGWRSGGMVGAVGAGGLQGEAWEMMVRHAVIQGAASVVALGAVAGYVAMSDGLRRVMYPPVLLLVMMSVTATLVGAHLAGRAAYEHGVGTRATMGREAATMPAGGEAWGDRVAWVAPPLEAHGALAGLGMGLGVMALACAMRNTHLERAGPVGDSPRQIHPGTGRADTPPTALLPMRLPATRLWLATVVVVLCTGATGWWHLSREMGTTVPRELWELAVPFPVGEVLKAENREEVRRVVHMGLGTVLGGVPVVLGVWGWLRPRGRVVLVVLGAVWLLAAAAQVWVGTLLLWEGPVGAMTGFRSGG